MHFWFLSSGPERTSVFMIYKVLLFLALLGGLPFPAQAQDNGPDPFDFAQTASACISSALNAQGGDQSKIPTEWRDVQRRTQIWALLYGYSIAASYPQPNPPLALEGADGCASTMSALREALAQAETQVFAQA